MSRRRPRKYQSDSDSDAENEPVLDEQEQDQLIAAMQLKMAKQDDVYKTAFSAVMLFPTPLFVFLPYCRHNPSISLISLMAIVLSTFNLYYLAGSVKATGGLKRTVSLGSLGLSVLVAFVAYMKHWPWKGYDYIWLVPIFASLTSILVTQWIDDMYDEVLELSKARYNLRGA